MMITPTWRTRLYAVAGGLIAIWLGFAVAQEDYFLPTLAVGLTAGFLALRLLPLPLPAVLLGGALLGYIVGNRGFAQLYLARGLPLLPAELVLGFGLAVLVIQRAFRRELPFRKDLLNLAIVAWIVIGAGRLPFDFQENGVEALRDFAMVYYAAFFFLAQDAAGDERSRKFLHACLLVGCALLTLLKIPYELFQGFFLQTFTFRGNPVIYYKGDLVGIFMGLGGVLFFLRYEKNGRKAWLVTSLVLVAAMLTTNSRASMLGLSAATLFLAIGGRWRFLRTQAVAGASTAVLVLLVAYVANVPWEKTPLYGAYERVVSLADPLGQNSYSGSETYSKGDNNLFRSVWWRNVFEETLEENPYLGLGFGYDLAGRFVREYYPDVDDFATRSPHNVLLTIFARMGLLGFACFLSILWLVAIRTYRSVRAAPPDTAALWSGSWVIFVSACFGVVLEGPMGALVFWSVLGLASGSPQVAEEFPVAGSAALQPAPRADEVAVSL